MTERYNIKIDDLPPDFREIAEVIGLEAALLLVSVRGGEAVYIPKGDKVARLARNRAILAEFDGANHRALARKYDLTVVMIRNIVNDHPKSGAGADARPRQLSLFGG